MLDSGNISTLVDSVIDKYGTIYSNLLDKRAEIKYVIEQEVQKFMKTIMEGLKKFEKGEDPFVLFTSYGFPLELTLELAKEKGKNIDIDLFNKKME
jgi:alanyl-tRNA synthetase